MSNGPSLRPDAILDVDKTCLHFTIEREARQEAPVPIMLSTVLEIANCA